MESVPNDKANSTNARRGPAHDNAQPHIDRGAAQRQRRGWRPRRIHEWVGVLVFGFSFCFALLGVFLPVYSDRGIAFALAENILVGIVSGAVLGSAAAAGVWLLGALISSTRWWSWVALVALVVASIGVLFVGPNGQSDSLDLGVSLGGMLLSACLVTMVLKASRRTTPPETPPE